MLSVLASVGHAENDAVQSEKDFEKALRNSSASSQFVLVTIVNDRTAETRTECMPAPVLLLAIHRENGLPFDPWSREVARQIAFTNTSRVFRFSKQPAIDALAFPEQRRGLHAEACVLVRQGKSVSLTEGGGKIQVEP
jgi:hypothetical protein